MKPGHVEQNAVRPKPVTSQNRLGTEIGLGKFAQQLRPKRRAAPAGARGRKFNQSWPNCAPKRQFGVVSSQSVFQNQAVNQARKRGPRIEAAFQSEGAAPAASAKAPAASEPNQVMPIFIGAGPEIGLAGRNAVETDGRCS